MPQGLADDVRVGTMVRVELSGRRVAGWVVELDVEPPAGRVLRPLAKVTGWGPPPELVELADWAAWRWAGRTAHFLGTASPPGAVRGLPAPEVGPPPQPAVRHALVEAALREPCAVLRLPPAADVFGVVEAALQLGPTLVVCPDHAIAAHVGLRARRARVPTAVLPREWARAAAGVRLVVGARGAAWAPVAGLAAVVVVDEHDEGHQEEGSPTWHARDVALERARRAGVPCVLASPCPSLEALEAGPLLAPERSVERTGWPAVQVVDRRQDDPLRSDLYSSRLVDLVRSGRRVVCVLNRKGRARLLVCGTCREVARCEACHAAVQERGDGLGCPRCGLERPRLCAACGSTRLKVLRVGVSRAREDLERLAGVPVGEVTGEGRGGEPMPDAPVLVGTEAVLHRVERVDAVAFLDLDQELLAPRYRAGEQALALLARAARLVGGRHEGGRLLLQTRVPDHVAIDAALHGDPARLATAELPQRTALGFPPATALAEVGGAGAEAFVAALPTTTGLEVLGPSDGRWLLRAPDHATLCGALAATPRPPGRLRLAVDPPRI